MQSLAHMVERMTVEQEQLVSERDMLADCVRSLQELQRQPQRPADARAQARKPHASAAA